jgi:[acyl-carrier-protein] S-malonyltransferase
MKQVNGGNAMPSPFANNLRHTALAFRGYNVTNLGRTADLLAEHAYESIVAHELVRFGAICAEVTGKSVDLIKRVKERQEPGFEFYAESIALIVAAEVAQLRLLQEIHRVDTTRIGLSFGYSLGELVAASCSGVMAPDHMIRVPLTMAASAVALAKDVVMGVLFSRGPGIKFSHVQRLCEEITCEGQGTIGVSSILSPNSYLLLGQKDTISSFRARMKHHLPHRAQLRVNEHRWPPLHTPIVRQFFIPDRATLLMETMPTNNAPPSPPVFSLVTGKHSYRDSSPLEVLRQWVDQPQRLWDAVDHSLAEGIETVIHVGPEPNLILATFARLSENIREQTTGTSFSSLSMRAVAGLARHSWLAGLLPARSNLLRAPYVNHVILENWLLENAPK